MRLRALVVVGLALGCGSRAASPAMPPAEQAPSRASRWASDFQRLEGARRSGDSRTAPSLVSEMRELAPNNPQLLLALARMAAERGDVAGAARWL